MCIFYVFVCVLSVYFFTGSLEILSKRESFGLPSKSIIKLSWFMSVVCNGSRLSSFAMMFQINYLVAFSHLMNRERRKRTVSKGRNSWRKKIKNDNNKKVDKIIGTYDPSPEIGHDSSNTRQICSPRSKCRLKGIKLEGKIIRWNVWEIIIRVNY